MSVMFGRWNFNGESPTPQYLDAVRATITPYAPDGGHSYSSKGGIDVLYHAFHTTSDSRRETQPLVTRSGAVVTWDGRLDNRQELKHECREMLPNDPPDALIVAAAYDEWTTECFAKLVGDWALAIWVPNDRSLILARDAVGTRPLYWCIENNQITWSTILDPLVLHAGRAFELDEEYIAGWFSFFPAVHLTPYVGILSVPPSSFVRIGKGKRSVKQYWDFNPAKQIKYRTDAEYEEHFRLVFEQSLRRRLRSDLPILAELSGGMDSSAIVCAADAVIAREGAATPRLDTLSYYNDAEPNWNERPYFEKVEEKRGRTGCHIDVGSHDSFAFAFEGDRFSSAPGSGGDHTLKVAREFAACLASNGNRVVLSGNGGDEVTGGVPSPEPELADLVTRAHFREFAHQLKVWALNRRRPWLHLLFESARPFFSPNFLGVPIHLRPAPWLDAHFVRRNSAALAGYQRRLKLFGPLPSFQENLNTLNSLRRQLGCNGLPCSPTYEKCYPFLDRDLLEFFYAVPRGQVVRPGERRSLMRRALVGIVPDELLNRKRKAYVVRSPMAAVSSQWANLQATTHDMISSSLGLVNKEKFLEAMANADRGQEMPIVILLRTLAIEIWLREIDSRKVLRGRGQETARNPATLNAQHAPHQGEIKSSAS